MFKGLLLLMITFASGCAPSKPQTLKADVYSTSESAQSLGTISFTDTKNGLLVEVDLEDLPAGEHGFHIHENPDCGTKADATGQIQPALAAGGHYDPAHTGKHLGPHGAGHKGDLPALMVNSNGIVKTAFYLDNLTTDEIKNRSVIIHAGGDNYQDTPLPLGGGGARIACGIIE